MYYNVDNFVYVIFCLTWLPSLVEYIAFLSAKTINLENLFFYVHIFLKQQSKMKL